MINQYFQSQTGVTTEQNLIQNLTTEVIRQQGRDLVYIPRELNMTSWDNILHEAPLSTFSTFYTIEGLVENADGFGDSQEIAAKFGLLIEQEIEISFSIPRFQTVTSMDHPLEGDLIYYEPTQSLFEISHINDEVNFKTLDSFTRFTVKAKLFQYSAETMATGINDIDGLNDNELEDLYSDNTLFETLSDEVTIDNPDDIFGGF